MVKMTPLARRKPRQLSGGQQQRVALARALVNKPSVLLLDEPLGALDRKLRQEMQIELKLLQTQVGITFIFVTHDQEEALSMSDRIVVMLDGHVEQARGPGHDLRPARVGVRRRLHRPAELPARHREGRRPRARGRRLHRDRGSRGRRRSAGQPRLAAVRPEAVTLELDVPDQAINAVHGRLAGISHLGDLIQYVVITTSGREMLSRQPRHEAPRLDPGADVWCRWETDRVQFFGGDQSTVVIADPAL